MIKEILNKIDKANLAYRTGKPIMSDKDYDILVDELYQLDPHNDFFSKVGHEILDESRKRRLPIAMASMNKVKSMSEISDWCRSKEIDIYKVVVITPKFDGLSLCVDENTQEAWTRGDGQFGQKSDNHYKLIGNKYSGSNLFDFTYGEVMMSKKCFLDKYSDFANPRNLVAGLLNNKSATNPLSDCSYIKYGAVLSEKGLSELFTKSDILDALNLGQSEKVNYYVCPISDLSEELLNGLFKKWSEKYEIDGLVIEVNDLQDQEEIGRETSSNNPSWARAYKSPSFEQTADTEILDISWNISKQGLIKPILRVNPVKLDGVTISNVTGNNARFVKDMGLGKGAIVRIKRSGMVIPMVSEVIKSVDFEMPNIPNIGWNSREIELITLEETDEQKIKQAVSFFEILGVENVSEGVVRQIWEAGHSSIKDILNLTVDDLMKIDRFGKRKASIVYNAISSKMKDVEIYKLQHATGLFKGLGSKKLMLLQHFKTKPTVDQILEIEGFAEISAKSYIDGYDKFFQFIKDLPITIKENVESIKISSDLDGMTFVFTGVRRADLENIIESRGGRVGSGVSKSTTHLIVKSIGSGSSKEKKAIDLGIEIITVEQLETLLK